MTQRSIEFRVGALILVAFALVGAFVVVMGGVTFQPTYKVYVAFQNPGGLTSGAPVRISGVKVGRVSDIEFIGAGDPQPADPEALIRAVVKIEKRYAGAIHDDARWFVTAQGVLGEMFLAVEPGTRSRPLLKEGAEVRGISPPQLDLLLSEGYELLHRTYRGLTDNEKKIAETFDRLHKTLGATGDLLERNGTRLDKMAENGEALTQEARETLAAARARYIDNPQIARILNDVERTSRSASTHLDPLLTDSRGLVSDTKKLTGVLASPEQVARFEGITRDLGAAAASAKATATEAEVLLQRVKQGKGTAGALMAEEALYDDLSELIRDLKHNPWKLLWKQ